MIREEVVDISEYDGDERCRHNYGGIWEQCTNTADKRVTVKNDLGEADVLVCEEHVDKLRSDE